MKKKKLALIITVLALSLLFAGCKDKTADTTTQVETTVETTTGAEVSTESTTDEVSGTEETTGTAVSTEETTAETSTEVSLQVSIDGTYTSKTEVAAYIYEYECLPSNFITKAEAKKLGWDSSKGNLWDVAPGCSIGGDRFGNYEGLLPDKNGRTYYECDIDYEGGYRGAERIIYSNDGLIYYTEDHYQTFELLYGQE